MPIRIETNITNQFQEPISQFGVETGAGQAIFPTSQVEHSENRRGDFLILFGPPGAGKTVAGEYLRDRYGYAFFDADMHRSPTEKERLARGEPSTDASRDQRFTDLIEKIRELRMENEKLEVITWLPVKYHEMYEKAFSDAMFIFLEAPLEEREDRINRRKTHFIQPEYLVELTRKWGEPMVNQPITVVNDGNMYDLRAKLDSIVSAFEKPDTVRQVEPDRSMQIFPIFDPITETHVEYKLRSQVHEQGDWHKGMQAHIIRKHPQDSNRFQALIQQRSDTVDINKGKMDQSLATQMLDIDRLDESMTLRRGLQEELGITLFRSMKVNVGGLRIAKTYKEYPTKYNREITSLYLVVVEDENQITKKSDKVRNIFWMDWEDFVISTQERPDDFTKTPQLYLRNDMLRSHIENLSHQFLGIVTRSSVPINDLSEVFFAYIDTEDGRKEMYVFNSREDAQNHQDIFNLRQII